MSNSGPEKNFETISEEINILLSNNAVSVGKQKEITNFLSDSSEMTPERLAKADQLLNEINDENAHIEIILSDRAKLDLSKCNLTRISPEIIKFLKDNAKTLQAINFSNIHLREVNSLLTLKFQNAVELTLSGNYLNNTQLKELKSKYPNLKSENQKEWESQFPELNQRYAYTEPLSSSQESINKNKLKK